MPNGPFVSIKLIPRTMQYLGFYGVSHEKIVKRFTRIIQHELDIQDRMFQKTYRTWRHRPAFDKEIHVTADSISGEIYTVDEVYGYINDGTNVRYATMDPRFRPKTRTRVIGSRAGKYPDPIRYDIARPGIVPRYFAEEIWKRRKRYFETKIQKATSSMIWIKVR